MQVAGIISAIKLVGSALTILFAIGMSTVALADGLSLSETELSFRGPRTEPIQRTFSVGGKPLPKISVVRRDLVNPDNGVVILSNNIAVTTVSRKEATENAIGEETFSVTISPNTRSGNYAGTLELRSDAQPPEVLTIKLNVNFEPVPSVNVDTSSKSLTLLLRQPWSDIPFVGRPRAASEMLSGGKAALPELTLYLVQNAEGDAVVDYATVLPLRASKGQTLPSETLMFDSTFPTSI